MHTRHGEARVRRSAWQIEAQRPILNRAVVLVCSCWVRKLSASLTAAV